MELIEKTKILDIITGIIPWDIPEWLALVILGFILVLAIYIIVKVGDMVFKIILTIAVIILIYLLVTGGISIPFVPDKLPDAQTAFTYFSQIL